MEFTQVRTKAQEILVKKDQEIKKLRDKSGTSKTEEATGNEDNSGIESDSSDEEDGKKKSLEQPFQSID